MTEITETVARKVLTNIDAGLCSGLGEPIPGRMCIMAAINHAMGNAHGDKPNCVHPVVRAFDIRLNDANWSSNEARAKGMRREGIAKLGSTEIDGLKFAKAVALGSIRHILPIVLRLAASKGGKHAAELESSAKDCESATHENALVVARAARSAAYAYAYADAYADASADAYAYAKRDEILALSAEIACEALIECGSEGAKYLWLCDEVAA